MKPCNNLCPQGDCAGCTGERFPAIPPSVRTQANDLLDSLKAGANVTADRVTWALRMTGDLTDHSARAHLGGGQ